MARINKRKDILAAAEKIFSQKGSAATMGEIGERAGVTDSVIYHYFKNKDDLMFSVLSERLRLELQVGDDQLEGIVDPVSRLSKLIWLQFRYHDRNPDYASLQLFECRSNRKFRRHEAHHLTMQWASKFNDALVEGAASGIFDPDLNIQVARDAVLGLLDMENIFCLATGETQDNLSDHPDILALVLAMVSPRSARSGSLEERAQRILHAAEKVIAEKGFSKARITEIAARAGVSEGGIYEHFKSKDALLFSVMDQGFCHHIRTFDPALYEASPIARLRRFIKLHFMLYCERAEFLTIFLTDGIFNKKFYTSDAFGRFQGYLSVLDDILREGKAMGCIRPQIDGRLFRNLFLGTFCHMSLRWRFTQASQHMNTLQEINAAVDLMVRAVGQ